MKQIICIGSSAKDIFFPTNGGIITETPEDILSQKKILFELGAKYAISDRFESLGGCSINVACGLARLGESVSCYTVLGNDLIGEWIKNEIKKENVNSSLIETQECLSGLSAIIVDKNSGERVIFSNQEANENMKVISEKLGEADWIFISDPGGDWKKIAEDVLKVSEKNGAKVAFNPRGKNLEEDSKKVYELAGKTEIFFVNKDEAIEITKSIDKEVSDLNNEAYLIAELKKSGAKVVVITDGRRGAWVSDEKETCHANGLEVDTIDTTGAGDAFSSGFLAAYIKDKNLAECLQWGIANSSSVVQFYGGTEGLLDENKIVDKTKEIKVEKI